MSFTSLIFPVFLCIVVITYSLITPRLRLSLLLLSSYAFYSWSNLAFVPLLILSTCIHYFGALAIAASEVRKRRFAIAAFCVIVDLAVLGFFKYSGVALAAGSRLFPGVTSPVHGMVTHLVLPAAISFYTLQSIGYTVDVYRGRFPPERNFQRFALYVAFFPQLVAGPIERAHQLLPQLHSFRRVTAVELRDGALMILWGLFKKLVVADRLAQFCDPILAHPDMYSPAQVIAATYVFIYRLYCDVGGYTDIAIGAAAMFGVRLMSNFDRPFAATSMRGIWQRWHISLTRWMMEFVYLPLASAAPHRAGRTVATIAVFVMIGLWHGPSWNYIAFGFCMGSVIVLGDLRRKMIPSPPLLLPKRWRPIWARLACWTILAATVVVFAPPNLVTTGRVFLRAGTVFSSAPGVDRLLAGPPFSPYEWVIALASVLVVEAAERLRRDGTFAAVLDRATVHARWATAYAVSFSTLIFGEFNPLPFYYFRF